ncbi:DNA binding domain, excisionase family [compost metagenome]
MNEFFFVPFPFPEESPTSLIKRFVIKHGCVSPTQFHSLGAPPSNANAQQLSSLGNVPAWIAKIAGVHGDRFLSGFYTPTVIAGSKYHIVNGVTVKDRMLRWSGTGFCSECWRTGKEHFIKDFRVCMHCPLHDRTYLFTCPTCKLRLHWLNTLTLQCRVCQNEITSPPCNPKEAEPEQTLLNWFRESKQENIDYFERALLLLNYKFPVLGHDENRYTLIAAIAIVEGDKKALENYLFTLHYHHPHLERRVISAALSRVKTEAARSAVLTFLESDAPPLSLSPISISALTPLQKQPLSLSRFQLKKLIGLPEKLWLIFLREQQSLWRSVGSGHLFSENLILQLLEAAEELKGRNLTPNIEPEKNMTLDVVAQRLRVPLNTIKRLIRENLLDTTTLSNHHNIGMSEAQLHSFTEKYETLDHLSERTNRTKRAIRLAMHTLNISPYTPITFKYLTLIHRHDTESIIHYLEGHKPYHRRNSATGDHLKLVDEQNLDAYCTFNEASKLLGFTDSSIAALIKNGWFTPHRKRSGGSTAIYLLITEVIFAKHNFLKATDYSKMIGTSVPIATNLVISLGIKPITGPLRDGSSTHIFLRKDIDSLISHNTSSTEESMTILEASKYLKLTAKTIISLLKTHDLSSDCDGGQSSLFISKSKATNFATTHVNGITISRWCGIPTTKIGSFLAQKNIFPVHEKQGVASETIYRVRDLTCIGFVLSKAKTKKTYLKTLISTREVCIKLNISSCALTRNFIKTGYIKIIHAQKRRWVSPEDYKKLRGLLKVVCTVGMADARIGLKYYFRELLAKGEIRIASGLPPELSGKQLIKQSDVSHHMKKINPHRSDDF